VDAWIDNGIASKGLLLKA